jgi:hypothetical protein
MDVRWARVHAAPWVARRVRGVSTGDGVNPKRPELVPLATVVTFSERGSAS